MSGARLILSPHGRTGAPCRGVALFAAAGLLAFGWSPVARAQPPVQFTLSPPLESGDHIGPVSATDRSGQPLPVVVSRPLILDLGSYSGPVTVRMEVNGAARVYEGDTSQSLQLALRAPGADAHSPRDSALSLTPMLWIILAAAGGGAAVTTLILLTVGRLARSTAGKGALAALPVQDTTTYAPAQSAGIPFRILRRLAEGGIANIYVCRRGLARPFLLKILRSQFQGDPDVSASIHHEARVLDYLTRQGWERCPRFISSGTSPVSAENEPGEWPWFAMSEVSGVALDQWLKNGPPAMDRAMCVACAVLDAVIEMHRLGVIHRDLSPANMILAGGRRPFIHLIDFGSSRVVEGTPWTHTMMSSDLPMHRDAYAAPEQIQGYASAAEPADTYAVGIMVYEILMGGNRPFSTRREHDGADRGRIISALTQSGIHKDVAHFIGFRALNVDPRQRTSLGELRFLLRGAYGF